MAGDSYDARDIVVLEGLEAVRRRPGMYIGDTRDGSGLHHLLWEVVANSLDEHLAGFGDRIRISVEEDLVEVQDWGRGISVAPHPHREGTMLDAWLTVLHAGATADGHAPHVHIAPGGFGLGLAPVNALCELFEVEVERDGYRFSISYSKGRPLGPLQRGPRTERTGTRIRFRPDPSIFDNVRFDRVAIRARLEELAIWNSRLTFDFMSAPIREPLGTVRWLDRLAVENECERGPNPFVVYTRHGDVSVEVAAAWSNEPIGELRSFVGQGVTAGGGSHVVGFWQGLMDGLAARQPQAFRRAPRGSRGRDRLISGLLGVVHVGLLHPTFAGPCRERLANDSVRDAVRAVVAEAFQRHLAEHPELEAALLSRVRSRD